MSWVSRKWLGIWAAVLYTVVTFLAGYDVGKFLTVFQDGGLLWFCAAAWGINAAKDVAPHFSKNPPPPVAPEEDKS